MRRFCVAIFLLLGLRAGAEPADSTVFAVLDSLLRRYYVALAVEDDSVKCAEMDYLIGTCRDSSVRQGVATRIYRHYRNSPLMGEESVALHVYDRWFVSGNVAFGTQEESVDAMVFATFERASMLYMQAERTVLQDSTGAGVGVPDTSAFSVLYFYETDCPKCRALSILLPHVLEDCTFPVTVYAVDTGSDASSWAAFRRSFRVLNPLVKVVHLWDPEAVSGYQMAYGVTGTPRLLAVTPSGMIAGRRLEAESIKELLTYYEIYEKQAQK